MDNETKKAKKYTSQPPAHVHSYSKLSKAESPRTHSSPTSILRKFPHSLRHDQKHQTKLKRNSVPAPILIDDYQDHDDIDDHQQSRTVKSWCIGDEKEQLEERKRKIGVVNPIHIKNLIIKNKEIKKNKKYQTVPELEQSYACVMDANATSQCFVKESSNLTPSIHKSTPDLSEQTPSEGKKVPLKTSDSLPTLNYKKQFINTIIPKINHTIHESREEFNNLRHIDSIDSIEDENTNLLSTDRRKIEIMPNFKNFVSRKSSKELIKTVGSIDSINLLSRYKIEPVKPVNRLRVPPNHFGGSSSKMCSRCSSLLSMASSSRYSINTTGSSFIQCSDVQEPLLLCKLCLMEVPSSQSLEIQQCGCIFCKDCMRLYVEFEIQEGAYDISCPDAQCDKQGVITLDEVHLLVTHEMVERYKRFRLNREVDMDRNRTWCPRAGCETVCTICPREKCLPTNVHCPTCDSHFCSNCKNEWHPGLTCEENTKKLAKEGKLEMLEPGIPFDSDLIKCCPMCNVPIEKDEGCAQMMCKRCKHVFCWYCLASLDDDFLLRHYDKGPCKNKLGHSRASVIWHRTQVIGIFAGFGILLLVASPLLLLAAPCIVCCKCRVCGGGGKIDETDDVITDETKPNGSYQVFEM